MSWNGEIAIDLDSHIVERADRFCGEYIDPVYREAYQRLCDAIAQQAKAGPAQGPRGGLPARRRRRSEHGGAPR